MGGGSTLRDPGLWGGKNDRSKRTHHRWAQNTVFQKNFPGKGPRSRAVSTQWWTKRKKERHHPQETSPTGDEKIRGGGYGEKAPQKLKKKPMP